MALKWSLRKDNPVHEPVDVLLTEGEKAREIVNALMRCFVGTHGSCVWEVPPYGGMTFYHQHLQFEVSADLFLSLYLPKFFL